LEDSSRLSSQERPETSRRAAGIRGEPARWASVEDDLDFIRDTGANLLIIGPEHLVMNVIRLVVADAPASIVIPCEAGRLPLSRASLPSGTLVFLDIDALDADGQAFLLEWLESAGAGRQIVSTASDSLLTMINAGAFDPLLYYRLNTVCIRLGE